MEAKTPIMEAACQALLEITKLNKVNLANNLGTPMIAKNINKRL